jgi:hypothetical protein
MPKKRQGGKTQGRKRKRPVKDLAAKRGGDVQGGGAGKLTFGAPATDLTSKGERP